jgi:hypothetical protein
MQEFLDEQEKQVKKMAKFDLDEEDRLKKLSVYEFLFHLQCLHDESE